MADQYTRALLVGVAEFLADLPLGSDPLATFDPTGKYTSSSVRPVYFRSATEEFDERWQIIAGQATAGANNAIVTPVQFLYRGPRNGSYLAALDIMDTLIDALTPHGRPLNHHPFGAVRIGQVGNRTGGQLPDDDNKRVRFSLTYQFRGKRFTV